MATRYAGNKQVYIVRLSHVFNEHNKNLNQII